MGLVSPDLGHRSHLRHPGLHRSTARQRVGFLPENPVFYDYLSGDELLIVLRPALRAEPAGRAGAGDDLAGSCRPGRRTASGGATVFEGDGAAARRGAGPGPRPRAGRPRRADVGPRSDRPARRPRPDPVAATTRAGRFCSAATSCRMPRPCAAAWRSSRPAHCRHWAASVNSSSSRCAPGNCCSTAPARRSCAQLRNAGVEVSDLSHGRVAAQLAGSLAPEPFVQMASAAGARVLSLQPVRETLEDVFMRHVEGKRRDGREPGGDDMNGRLVRARRAEHVP